jgi:hypothetical protein
VTHDVLTRPWESVGTDIFTFNYYDHLITVDYLSDYFEIVQLASKTMHEVVYCLKKQFARNEIPDMLYFDKNRSTHASLKHLRRNMNSSL